MVLSVSTIDFPYTIIIFLAYFNRAPVHHFRIGYISTNVSMLFVMIGLFFYDGFTQNSYHKENQTATKHGSRKGGVTVF